MIINPYDNHDTIASMRKIRLATTLPEPVQANLDKYPEILQKLLYHRGIDTARQAEQFLDFEYESNLHDPFLLPDSRKAVDRILRAINNEEHIAIFADYDSDGIPGAVLAHDFFTAIGYSNFSIHIPHRHYDGFGLSVENVKQIVNQNKPDLIITIDCGTGDREALEYATSAGLEVIVTDHHEPNGTDLLAYATVNPKCSDTYPFPDLCGTGVFFKLIQAILQVDRLGVKPGQEKWWLDMVAIATIADMVPLIGENRVLAHYGLLVLRKSRRPGLQQLLRKQRVKQQTLTEDDIGFVIGPRINAASRMDTPEDAFHLLSTTDEGEAGARLGHLEKLNQSRKTEVAKITKELHQRIGALPELPTVLAFGNPEWRPSLVGLAANKLAEEYGRPAFLWGRDGNGVYKGSCRSGGGVSVVSLMEAVREKVFSVFGGHHMSGGFSIQDEAIHELAPELQTAYSTLGEKAHAEQVYTVTEVLALEDVNRDFIQSLKRLTPFGLKNEKPIFAFLEIDPLEVTVFGKTAEHTKLTFTGSGLVREAIAFFTTPEQFTYPIKQGEPVSFLAYVEESYFMNRYQVRLRIIDTIKPSDIEK